MIPYPIEEVMTQENSWYNCLHSHANNRLNGNWDSEDRFRVLKVPLNQKPDLEAELIETQEMGRVLAACFVLHYIFQDRQDLEEVSFDDVFTEIEDVAWQSSWRTMHWQSKARPNTELSWWQKSYQKQILFISSRFVYITLTHSGNIVSSAKLFGMSKSSADWFIWQVFEVIGRALKPIFIKLPQSAEEKK